MTSLEIPFSYTGADQLIAAINNIDRRLNALAANVAHDSQQAEAGLNRVRTSATSVADTLGKIGLAGIGFATIKNVVGGVIDVFEGMSKAASDDEASQNRLINTLKNNVIGWQQYTGAIGDTIAAGQRLAFSDDDQRDSLNLLLARTHDAAAAQTELATAEDLARFGKTSLIDATKSLLREEDGSVKSLRAMGIAVTKEMSDEQALAVIHQTTANAAADFAASSAGAAARVSDALSELSESAGAALNQLISGPLKGLADMLQSSAFQAGMQGVFQFITDHAGDVAIALGVVAAGFVAVNAAAIAAAVSEALAFAPVVLAIAAVSAIVWGFRTAWESDFANIREVAEAVGHAVETALGWIGTALDFLSGKANTTGMTIGANFTDGLQNNITDGNTSKIQPAVDAIGTTLDITQPSGTTGTAVGTAYIDNGSAGIVPALTSGTPKISAAMQHILDVMNAPADAALRAVATSDGYTVTLDTTIRAAGSTINTAAINLSNNLDVNGHAGSVGGKVADAYTQSILDWLAKQKGGISGYADNDAAAMNASGTAAKAGKDTSDGFTIAALKSLRDAVASFQSAGMKMGNGLNAGIIPGLQTAFLNVQNYVKTIRQLLSGVQTPAGKVAGDGAKGAVGVAAGWATAGLDNAIPGMGSRSLETVVTKPLSAQIGFPQVADDAKKGGAAAKQAAADTVAAAAQIVSALESMGETSTTEGKTVVQALGPWTDLFKEKMPAAFDFVKSDYALLLAGLKAGTVDMGTVASTVEADLERLAASSDANIAALGQNALEQWRSQQQGVIDAGTAAQKTLDDQRTAQNQKDEAARQKAQAVVEQAALATLNSLGDLAREASDPKHNIGQVMADALELAKQATAANMPDIANLAMGYFDQMKSGADVDFTAMAQALEDANATMLTSTDNYIAANAAKNAAGWAQYLADQKAALDQASQQSIDAANLTLQGFVDQSYRMKQTAINDADEVAKAMLDPDRNPGDLKLKLLKLEADATDAGYKDIAAKARTWLEAIKRGDKIDYGLMEADLNITMDTQVGIADEGLRALLETHSVGWHKITDAVWDEQNKIVDISKNTMEALKNTAAKIKEQMSHIEIDTQPTPAAPKDTTASPMQQLDFLKALADPKTVLPSKERIDAFWAAAQYVLDLFSKASEDFKSKASDEAARIAANIGAVMGGIGASLDPLLKMGDVQKVSRESIEGAFSNLWFALHELGEVMKSGELQGDFQARAVAFAATITTIFDALGEVATVGVAAGKGVDFSGLLNGIQGALEAIGPIMQKQFDPKTEGSVAATWQQGWIDLRDYVRNDWSVKIKDILILSLDDMRLSIQGKAAGFLEAGKTIGGNIDDGMKQGLDAGKSTVIDAAVQVALDAYNAAKTALGIGSPSKLFAYLGKMSSQGYADGVAAGKPAVDTALNSLISSDSAASSVSTFADSVEYMLGRLQTMAKQWGGGGAKAIQLMGDAIGSVVGGLSGSLALFKDLADPKTVLPDPAVLQGYLNEVGQFFDMFRALAGTSKWKQDVTKTAAALAHDIGSAVADLLAPLDKLRDLADPKLLLPSGTIIGNYFSNLTDFVNNFAAHTDTWAGQVDQTKADLAKQVGDTISSLLGALDITKLIGMPVISQGSIDRFFDALGRFVKAFIEKAGTATTGWQVDITDATKTLADRLGSSFDGLLKGFDVLSKIDELGSISQSRIDRAFNGLQMVLTGLDNFLANVTTQNLNLDALSAFAVTIGGVFSNLKVALDGLQQFSDVAIPSADRINKVFSAMQAVANHGGPDSGATSVTQAASVAAPQLVLQVLIQDKSGATHVGSVAELADMGLTLRLSGGLISG